MVYSLSFLHYLIPASPSPRADRRRGDEKQCQGSRGERRRGRAVQTGGARHPRFSPASGDSEWEAEGRPLRELRWGVQLGISQGRKTCRPWDLRAPHSGQPPSRPQHFRESPPKGRGETAASPVSSSMFSWASKDARRKKEPELFQTVSEGLRQLYAQKLLPLEEHCRFHEFHSAALEDADFDNKPMVLLVGQYSTGKTTFIQHLMEPGLPGDAHRARAHDRGHARPHQGRGARQRARRPPGPSASSTPSATPSSTGLRSTWPVPMAMQWWSLCSWRENASLTSVTMKTGQR
ncbi:PREDICTED: sarcalumenin-like [Capra hircus]|uniref:sarcalumenin-like n=1 Tax=Capra hircus TaxID=9925 RepID=UPI00084761AE|nr:PREDICTED: sarcalumenin-like [Capra hircus]